MLTFYYLNPAITFYNSNVTFGPEHFFYYHISKLFILTKQPISHTKSEYMLNAHMLLSTSQLQVYYKSHC